MEYGTLLLSKLIEENRYDKVVEFKLTKDDFLTSTEKSVFDFIDNYAKSNYRSMPDYRSVLREVPDFMFEPNVVDDYRYLVRQTKGYAAKVEAMKLLNDEATSKFTELGGIEFIDWLADQLVDIKQNRSENGKVGTSLIHDRKRVKDEYNRRKTGEAFRVFPSAFPSLNESMGGYQTSNLYTIYGRSGRGKSILSLVEVLNAVINYECTVLVWSLEMSSYEWLARAFAYISATQGMVRAFIDGDEFDAGFRTNDILYGKFTEEFEDAFLDFLDNMEKYIKGNIIIRGVNDDDWVDRSLDQLESDLETTKADICLIDPAYYIDMESNKSRTAGGDLQATSNRLRKLAGRKDVAIITITQAEEVQREQDEEGNRQLTLPSRSEMKKSKALLEDASCSIGFDSLNGRGLIGINKGRSGGEGTEVEIIFHPSVGLVKEMDLSTLSSSLNF